jgi:Rieske Fe-S protein
MNHPTDLTRRTVLAAGGVGVALALGGCATTPENGNDAAPGTGSAPGSGTASPSEGTSTPSPSQGPAGAPAAEIAKLADIPVGGAISATLAGAPILISQPLAGTVVAFSAICTHQQCVVAPAKGEFDCPCHGSRFNSTSGEVLGGPALKPLSKVQVAVSGDSIVAG